MKTLKIIVAVDLKNGIGKDGKLLFQIREDMQHFTDKTTGGYVIMRSKTYESIPKKYRPLKDRVENIVISRDLKKFSDENVIVVNDLDSAIKLTTDSVDVWIIGGAGLYEEALPIASEIELTQIFAERDADTFFPEFKDNFKLKSQSEKMFNEKNQVDFQFQTWVRK